jgi:hypothetical protein
MICHHSNIFLHSNNPKYFWNIPGDNLLISAIHITTFFQILNLPSSSSSLCKFKVFRILIWKGMQSSPYYNKLVLAIESIHHRDIKLLDGLSRNTISIVSTRSSGKACLSDFKIQAFSNLNISNLISNSLMCLNLVGNRKHSSCDAFPTYIHSIFELNSLKWLEILLNG